MKTIIKQQMTSPILLLIALSSSTHAELMPNLPKSSQLSLESNDNSEIEILKEITIQVGESNQVKNPKLKDGKACEDEDLPPAELSPDEYEDIPMAETLPCDTVNCENLKAARLLKDTYKEIPMAETTKIKPCLTK